MYRCTQIRGIQRSFFHYEDALMVVSVQHVMLRQEWRVPRRGERPIREQSRMNRLHVISILSRQQTAPGHPHDLSLLLSHAVLLELGHRQYTLLSASVNSLGSMPSLLYQGREALNPKVAVKLSEGLHSSWMDGALAGEGGRGL